MGSTLAARHSKMPPRGSISNICVPATNLESTLCWQFHTSDHILAVTGRASLLRWRVLWQHSMPRCPRRRSTTGMSTCSSSSVRLLISTIRQRTILSRYGSGRDKPPRFHRVLLPCPSKALGQAQTIVFIEMLVCFVHDSLEMFSTPQLSPYDSRFAIYFRKFMIA